MGNALDHLMPMPVAVRPGVGAHLLNSLSVPALSPRLAAAVERLQARLKRRFGAALSSGPPPKSPSFSIEMSDPSSQVPMPDMDESYALTVTADALRLVAPTEIGALRGLQTFFQLITHEGGAWQVPCCEIEDAPRFSWRGMLLDTSRHFMAVEDVTRLLDCMEMAKLNVLHFHLANDQGFRMECETFPKLHEDGSEGDYYTKAQMREMIATAADRGIRIVPEFCLPGHAVPWQVAYPELSASEDPPSRIGETRGSFSIPIDPSREETYAFIDAFVAEMAEFFPDPHFHTGGDEVNPTSWKENLRIKAFMDGQGFKSGRDLQAYFTGRYAKLVAKYGKIPIGWEEVLHSDAPSNVIVHLWKDGDYSADLMRHPVLTSWNTYLDLQQPSEWLYGKDPLDFRIEGKPPPEGLNVAGAEMTNWAETINGGNLDMRTWPRGAAIAERFWSARSFCDEAGKETLYERLETFSSCLSAAGSNHEGHARRACVDLYGASAGEAVGRLSDVAEPAAYPFLRRRRLLLERAFPRLFTAPDVQRYSDMRRFVDHLPGESLVGRKFRLDVEELTQTGDHELARRVAGHLKEWEALAQEVRTLARQNPAMRAGGLDKIGVGLGRIAKIGSLAMQTMQKGTTLSSVRGWWYHKRLKAYAYETFYLDKDVVKRVIRDMRKPDVLNQHNIAILPGVAHLLKMACGEGH